MSYETITRPTTMSRAIGLLAKQESYKRPATVSIPADRPPEITIDIHRFDDGTVSARMERLGLPRGRAKTVHAAAKALRAAPAPEAGTSPKIRLAERRKAAVVQQITARGLTRPAGFDGAKSLEVLDMAEGLVLVGGSWWYSYKGNAGSYRQHCAYLGGRDDAGEWAVRVPSTCETVAEALAWTRGAQPHRGRGRLAPPGRRARRRHPRPAGPHRRRAARQPHPHEPRGRRLDPQAQLGSPRRPAVRQAPVEALPPAAGRGARGQEGLTATRGPAFAGPVIINPKAKGARHEPHDGSPELQADGASTGKAGPL